MCRSCTAFTLYIFELLNSSFASGNLSELKKLEGSEGTNVLRFMKEDYCLLTSRTTERSDDFP